MTITAAVFLSTWTTAPPSEAASVSRSSASKTCPKLFTQSKHATYARRVLRRDRITEKAKKRLVTMRVCQHSDVARRNTRRLARRHRKARKRRLAATPYACGRHGRFAVPCYIVACESRFNPRADNGSHWGYYQARYEYLRGDRSVANQHRVAARLWRGGKGRGHWECA